MAVAYKPNTEIAAWHNTQSSISSRTLDGLNVIPAVPLSAQFWSGRWDFGRNGWANRQIGGESQIQVTQPKSASWWNTLYIESDLRWALLWNRPIVKVLPIKMLNATIQHHGHPNMKCKIKQISPRIYIKTPGRHLASLAQFGTSQHKIHGKNRPFDKKGSTFSFDNMWNGRQIACKQGGQSG